MNLLQSAYFLEKKDKLMNLIHSSNAAEKAFQNDVVDDFVL